MDPSPSAPAPAPSPGVADARGDDPFGPRTTQFLATLAHELRNPLAPLKNGVEALRMPHDGAQERRTLDMMDRQLLHMGRLVEDLLDVARLGTGKMELQRGVIDLREVIAHAVELSQPVIDLRQHRLSQRLPHYPLWVQADAVRLCQVLANLLNNAAKYTPERGRIALHARREDRQAVVSVADNGAGIAPDMLPHVFEIFRQVGPGNGVASHGGHGGLGIGLALVQALVAMHGGSVTARSTGLGQGSTFTVRLPLVTTVRAQPAPAPDGAGARPANAESLRILVVDDHVDAAESLALILRMDGHLVLVAHDGRRALALAAQVHPQVVILDIGMPGMDGYEVARHLREMPEPAPLMVALTGWSSKDDELLARAAGFDHYLAKPADVAQVEKLLSQLRAPT